MTERLPAMLQEIADVVGLKAALAIASAAGGTRIYFPATLTMDHWLVQAIGAADSMKLCAHFAVDRRGQRFDIPIYFGTYRQMIRGIAEHVHKLDDDKESSQTIARRLGVTQRTVHRHRARRRGKAKPDSRQGQLF